MQTAIVVAQDGEAGTWHEVPVIVRKRFTIDFDCGCYRHLGSRMGSRFLVEAIVTVGGVYYRPAGSNEHFRETVHVGPVAVQTSEQSRME